MTYKTTEENNITTIYLDGEIDMEVGDKAKEAIMPLLDSSKEIHINLKDVQYMDSSGISVLIESHQKASELGKKVVLKEKALRYKGLALYKAGSFPEACATFIKLINSYPKRMYQQEFNKYCTN